MPTFPLPFRPKQNYRKGGLKFGADRDGGARKHAGCDLLAPKGTEIYAVETGEVVRSDGSPEGAGQGFSKQRAAQAPAEVRR